MTTDMTSAKPPALELRSLDASDPRESATLVVLAPNGQRLGHLKRIGAVWKFKAIGLAPDGALLPGGGPLTGRHNTVFAPGPGAGWPDTETVRLALQESTPG